MDHLTMQKYIGQCAARPGFCCAARVAASGYDLVMMYRIVSLASPLELSAIHSVMCTSCVTQPSPVPPTPVPPPRGGGGGAPSDDIVGAAPLPGLPAPAEPPATETTPTPPVEPGTGWAIPWTPPATPLTPAGDVVTVPSPPDPYGSKFRERYNQGGANPSVPPPDVGGAPPSSAADKKLLLNCDDFARSWSREHRLMLSQAYTTTVYLAGALPGACDDSRMPWCAPYSSNPDEQAAFDGSYMQMAIGAAVSGSMSKHDSGLGAYARLLARTIERLAEPDPDLRDVYHAYAAALQFVLRYSAREHTAFGTYTDDTYSTPVEGWPEQAYAAAAAYDAARMPYTAGAIRNAIAERTLVRFAIVPAAQALLKQSLEIIEAVRGDGTLSKCMQLAGMDWYNNQARWWTTNPPLSAGFTAELTDVTRDLGAAGLILRPNQAVADAAAGIGGIATAVEAPFIDVIGGVDGWRLTAPWHLRTVFGV